MPPFISNFNPTIMMGEDADIDRITKRTESVTKDIKELANIAAECPNCSRRFKEYLQSKNDEEINYEHYFLGTSASS